MARSLTPRRLVGSAERFGLERAGGDAAAEDSFLGHVLHIDEEWLEVAGQVHEEDDLGLADRPGHRPRAVADLHVLEIASHAAHGHCLLPLPEDARPNPGVAG